MSKARQRVGGVIVAIVAVAMSLAAMTATEAIQQRQKEMEGVRDGMMALGAIAKKQQPFDAEVVKANAAKIAGHLEEAAGLFPEGSDQGDVETWAKPEVWSDRARFDELLARSQQAAAALQEVTDAGAFPAALGALGNTCKSCHDPFRLPKQ